MKLLSRLVPAAVLIVTIGWCQSSEATNICNETVPANRLVDGFPAYAQCSTTTAGIYSNNGIDTRTTSGGTGWVTTQGSGGYQCTEFAHRYLYFRWNITSVPRGNAGTWCDNALPTGLVKATTPVHGDIIVFPPGTCGASATAGHVAVVDVVNANSTVTIVEQNAAGRRSCAISCATCFLHVQANDATGSAGAVPGKLSRDDVRIEVHGANVAIELSGAFEDGAWVRIFDLGGRLMADLSALPEDGRAVYDVTRWSAQALVVVICKGDVRVTRKIALGNHLP